MTNQLTEHLRTKKKDEDDQKAKDVIIIFVTTIFTKQTNHRQT